MSERPEKSVAESSAYLAEIVGEESLQGQRMQAGAILDMMDVLAGRIAIRHASSAVVTLSFDRVDLTYPILHQDLIRLEGKMAAVGNSTLIVDVQGYRMDSLSREYMPIQRSFITMVAVDDRLRPNRDIPALRCDSEEERELRREVLALKAVSKEWQRMQEEPTGKDTLTVAEVEDPINREKREYLTPAETEVRLRRIFLPRHNNVMGTIFGGDILLWLDRVATFTARQFTRNRHMVTIAMNRIFFKQPIYTTDLVDLTARVAYVRNYTLEVEIAVRIERQTGEELQSHSGFFNVLNYDEAGFKRPIITGLRLSDGDQEGLLRYRQAKHRYHFRKSREGKFNSAR